MYIHVGPRRVVSADSSCTLVNSHTAASLKKSRNKCRYVVTRIFLFLFFLFFVCFLFVFCFFLCQSRQYHTKTCRHILLFALSLKIYFQSSYPRRGQKTSIQVRPSVFRLSTSRPTKVRLERYHLVCTIQATAVHGIL